MGTAKKTSEIVEIKPIQWVRAKVRLVGDSPLIMHAWDAKAKREMLEKQIGATKTKAKEPKNPVADFVASMYWLTPQPEEFTMEAVSKALESARFGFPITAVKQAAVSAAYRNKWVKDKASLRGAFFLEADANGYYAGDLVVDHERNTVDIVPNVFRSEQLVEIHSDDVRMREDMVKIPMGGADIRYRGELNDWYADIVIKYDANGPWSIEQIVNIVNAGGAFCGLGEWRPEKDGQFGQFHVEVAD